MPVTVRIPTPLMKLTNNQSELSAEGATIADMLNNLESQYAGIKERICEENGTPRRFINIYLNEERRARHGDRSDRVAARKRGQAARRCHRPCA